MAERFYLQWNVVNWVTVVLMAMVGFLLLGAIGAGVKASRRGGVVDADD